MTEEDIISWKRKYNEYLQRHFKAELFLDNVKLPIEQREQWMPHYKDIINNLNYILSLFDSDGIKYTWDESMKGFQI